MCPPPCGPRRGRIGRPRVCKSFPYSWLNPKREERDNAVYSLDGKTLVKVSPFLEGDFIVPAGVERILKEAFAECRLAKIILPNSLKKVGSRAFAESYLLEEIHIPTSATVAEDAFYGCFRLKQK